MKLENAGRAETLTEQELSFLNKRAKIGREMIQEISLEPNQRKEKPSFTAQRVAELLGRTRQGVHKAANELGLGVTTGAGNNVRQCLSQADIETLMVRFDGAPATKKPCIVVALINQKGGVAKTTTAIHLAHYCSLMSLRTLAIDADSQGSLTAYMGVSPDVEVTEAMTLYPVLTGEHGDLRQLICKAPHFANLDYIPACLDLAMANEDSYMRQFTNKVTKSLAEQHGFEFERDDYVFYEQLKRALKGVRDDYDVIIIDCPPHITSSTYNVICAADVAIVPTSSSLLDIASTLRFIEWLEVTGKSVRLDLQRLMFLVTNFDGQKASTEAVGILRKLLGKSVLQSATSRSTEVARAGALLRSVYELREPLGSREAWARACESIDKVNTEIHLALKEIWASKGGV